LKGEIQADLPSFVEAPPAASSSGEPSVSKPSAAPPEPTENPRKKGSGLVP